MNPLFILSVTFFCLVKAFLILEIPAQGKKNIQTPEMLNVSKHGGLV